ncbi:hypothetical protein [Streptomyces dysideae]|uniref:Uncharacterized protein n=1 Tax=Streptomyces dysideae TaxID=909626 RepID=A0A117S2A6_9ACTN|nr:hypothetical protein [Streptomyces dysideae]KUO21889.1 hypothetical protein AQJ91_07085 [Streptomyces dysideae]
MHDPSHGQPPQGFGPPPPQYAPTPPPPYAPPQPQPVQPAGPEFLAVDRHNAVVIDATGVSFENHGLTADFPWQEIRSVHYQAAPTGNGVMVAVIHLDGRFYECAVDAKRRDRLQKWFGQLAAVLGYYRPID